MEKFRRIEVTSMVPSIKGTPIFFDAVLYLSPKVTGKDSVRLFQNITENLIIYGISNHVVKNN